MQIYSLLAINNTYLTLNTPMQHWFIKFSQVLIKDIVSLEIVLYITSILVWLYMVIVGRSVHSEYDCGEFRVNIDSSAVGRTLYPGQLFSQGSSACFKTSRLYNNDFQSPVSRFNDNLRMT